MKKHISILIPQGHTSLVNIVGAHQIFNQVNGFLTMRHANPIFEVELVGLIQPTKQTNGLFSVYPTKLLQDIKKTDLIIIPAIHDSPDDTLQNNYACIPWLQKHYANGSEIASLCVGAFLLAETGLLDGKQCSTHWIHANHFRKLYPEVHLLDDKIMTEDNGIYTSGGAYSFLNLLLYLIEKYTNREIAVLTAKAFMIDIDKVSQSPFIIFEGQKEHDDAPVKKAQSFIEENFNEKMNVNQLATKFALSRRSLERRFKSATSNTITEYIQRVKVEAAKKSLEAGRLPIQEVMHAVGYSDDKAFRDIFKRHTGMTPIAYRNRYSKNAVA